MKSGQFARLWRAGLVSSTGDWVAILATLSLAEELAGSGGIVLALVSRILPGLFFAAVGGVVADRLNRKWVMVSVEIGRAALVVSLAFADSIAYLVLVNLALEGLTLVFQPAKEASVPALVQRNELVQANSLSLSAAYGTFPLGAAIFLVIAPLGPHLTFGGLLPGTHEGLAFLIDSFTYLTSAAVIWTLTIPGRAPRRGRRKIDPMAPLRDLREGVVFVASHPRIRPVVLAMTGALAGGGIVVVLGKPFAKDVLNAGTAGFPALLTAFGMGAAAGIVLVTIFGPRLEHKDISFALSLLVAGFGLGATGFVRTVIGGSGWIAVMGFGAGSAYVLGFAHLQEQADDELRGRTFAALLSLMRIGLLTSMAAALPLAGVLDGVVPGLLGDGARMVLLVGGAIMLFSGIVTLWSVRRMLMELGHIERGPIVETGIQMMRTHRRRMRGEPDTEEIEALDRIDEPEGEAGP
jgi:dTMP kinase